MPEFDPNFEAQVSLVSEFMDRFNGKEAHPEIPNETKDFHRNNLIALFDLEWINQADSLTQLDAIAMVDSILSQNVNLHFADTTWHAVATCVVALASGDKSEITIKLRVEARDSLSYKWSIAEVNGEILALTGPPTKHIPFIIPSAHETHFIELIRVTNDRPKLAASYLSDGVSLDPTSVFMALAVTEQIKIVATKGIRFVFHAVPGFAFEIKYTERNSPNSGWLISSVSRT